jgi:hypothetical protein
VELGLATTQKLSDTIFIDDSGATSHMRYSTICMFNLAPCQTAVTVDSNETMHSQAKRTFKGSIHNKDGNSFPTILTDGRIIGISIIPPSTEAVYLTATPIDLETFHHQLGHPNCQVCTSTDTSLGIHTTGAPTLCVHCELSKSKKTMSPKTTLHHAAAKDECLALDNSYPNYTSFNGSKYWLLI